MGKGIREEDPGHGRTVNICASRCQWEMKVLGASLEAQIQGQVGESREYKEIINKGGRERKGGGKR